MDISADAWDVLNERLNSLGVPCIQSISLSDLNGTNISSSLLSNCNALLRELDKYDKSLSTTVACSSLDQVYDVLKSRKPHFSSDTTNFKFKLLQFLIAEIQIERLAGPAESLVPTNNTATTPESEMCVDDEEAHVLSAELSILAFQLDKICKLLQVQVDPNSFNGLNHVLEAVQQHVSTTLQHDSTLLMNCPPRILPETLVLTAPQKAKLAAVEDMLHQDFALRREMLIKRMEVTVESFLWSEKASCRENEDEIRTAVRTQQKHLAAPPRRYQLEDALGANVALLHEQSKKITGDSQLANTYSRSSNGSQGQGISCTAKSIIKQILVGSVPDRGGRANEVRPKQLRAEVRRAFGGGGGGGGGGDRDHRKSNKKSAESATPATTSVPTTSTGNNTTASSKSAQNKGAPNEGKGDRGRPKTSDGANKSNNNGNSNNKPQKDSGSNASSGAANSGRKVELQPTASDKTLGTQQGRKKNKDSGNGGGGVKR